VRTWDLDSAVSDKQELHYAHSGAADNAVGNENANKNDASKSAHAWPENTAAPAIQDRQGLREHQRGDVANYIAASIFRAV